jgi:hypothetical protein
MAAMLVNRVEPEYPRFSIVAHISGTVHLCAIIAKDGSVRELEGGRKSAAGAGSKGCGPEPALPANEVERRAHGSGNVHHRELRVELSVPGAPE